VLPDDIRIDAELKAKLDAYLVQGGKLVLSGESGLWRDRAEFAFDLGAAVERGAYDVVFIGQSLHHFTAGQLALMMAGTRDIQASAFVAVDGRRSLLLLSLIPGYGLCFKSLDFAHDALLSTRKFYSEPDHRIPFGIRSFDNYEDITGRRLKFYEQWKLGHRTNYGSKARFVVESKRFHFSNFAALRWLNGPINLEPVLFERFFATLITPEEVHFRLRVSKG
jgi:hypothetical protein